MKMNNEIDYLTIKCNMKVHQLASVPFAASSGRLWLTALLQAAFPQNLVALQLPFTNSYCTLK